jgi:hypothetical protein
MRFACIVQGGGFITQVQMKKLHGRIGPKALRPQLDGSLNPVLGLTGITEVQEKPAQGSGIEGIARVEGDGLRKPRHGFVELP